MKRCFYISNAYDGAYFVLTDNIDEYLQKMMAYMANLQRSGKCNHYSFGSVEMTEAEYENNRQKATTFEKDRIQSVQEKTLNTTSDTNGDKNKDKSKSDRQGLRLI